jgi:5-methylcytosine-specific restriction endonuclease McrA
MTTPWDHEKRRAFSPKERARIFMLRDGRCHRCTRKLLLKDEWSVEHLIALACGGDNSDENLGLTCSVCRPIKDGEDHSRAAKGKRIAQKHILGKPKTKTRPMPGTRSSGWKQKMSGEWVRR